MSYRLLVSFETRDWLRQGGLIVAAIEKFGPATRILGSSWFVLSDSSAEYMAGSIQQILGPDDGLLVVDLEAQIAAMANVDDRSEAFMRRHWREPLSLPRAAAGFRGDSG
jgi:hypothetical protein